jgi:hypothetical protein
VCCAIHRMHVGFVRTAQTCTEVPESAYPVTLKLIPHALSARDIALFALNKPGVLESN